MQRFIFFNNYAFLECKYCRNVGVASEDCICLEIVMSFIIVLKSMKPTEVFLAVCVLYIQVTSFSMRFFRIK